MMLLSVAWWTQRLSGLAAQAIGVVLVIAVVIGGLAWLRHDARLDERRASETRMANARVQQLLLRQRRERDAAAVGARAEKNLLEELDASAALINQLEAKLSTRPSRVVCYPADVARELNR
jgi:hypothetical protein